MRAEYSQSIIPVKSPSSLTVYSFGSSLSLMNFGDRLKLARERAGFTQKELEEKSKVTQGTISKIERGDADSSTFTVQLAVACGVRPEWLALEEGEMIPASPALADDAVVVDDPILKNALYALKKLPPEVRAEQVRGLYTLAEQIAQLKEKGNGTQ